VPDVRTVRPGVADPLWFAIQRAMAKSPADRFKTAGAFMAATRKESARPPKPGKRRWWWLAVMVLVVGTGATLLLRPTNSVLLNSDIVAVLPFALAASDESDRWLVTAMPLGIAQLLDGTGGLTAAAESRTEIALEAIGKTWKDVLSAGEARNVARQLGAGMYVTGEIVVSGGGERIVSVFLSDTETGDELNRAFISISEFGVASAMDRVLGALLIDVAGQARRSETLLSQSQPALRAFVDGWVARREGRRIDAAQHFLRAVQEDTTFALAALAWDEAQIWLVDGSVYRGPDITNFVRGVLHSNLARLPQLDQRVLALLDEPVFSRRERLEQLKEATLLAPDLPAVWISLGDFAFHDAPMFNLQDFREQATVAFDSALALGDITPEVQLHLDEISFDAGDSTFIRWYLEAPDSRGGFDGHNMDDTRSAALHWAAAWLLEDSAVIAAYDRVLDSLPGKALQQILRYSNRLIVGLSQADRAAEILAARSEVPGVVRAQVYGDLVAYHANRGRPQLVERLFAEQYGAADHPRVYEGVQRLFHPGLGDWSRQVDHSDALERLLMECSDPEDCYTRLGTAVRVNCGLGIRYARQSREEDARRHLSHIRAMRDHGPNGPTRKYAEICELLVAAALDDDVTAQRLLAEAALRLDPSPLTRVNVMSLTMTLASMLEVAGQPERALEFVTRRPFFVIESFYLTPALLLEGRLSLQVGDTARAISAYQGAVALLSDPEPSMEPIAREARGTLAELLAR